MQASQVIRIIVFICRAIQASLPSRALLRASALTRQQIPVALIALGLTASLLPTFQTLDADCEAAISGVECRRIGETVGGLKFSIGTAVLAILDVSIGLAAMWYPAVPSWLILTLDSMTAGFYIGSGSTIAARLNGELCETGPSDPNFACGRLFADMGFMFVGAVTGYVLVACFWASRARRCRSCTAEVDGGHALENPFQDPVGAESEPNHRVLHKRTSWSQRS